MLHENWDLYDTRHTVFQPRLLATSQLEEGYWKAYKDFYRWGSILRGAARKETILGQLRHMGYAAGWKKFEPLWDFVIRMRQVSTMLPVLETILTEFGARRALKARTMRQDPASEGWAHRSNVRDTAGHLG